MNTELYGFIELYFVKNQNKIKKTIMLIVLIVFTLKSLHKRIFLVTSSLKSVHVFVKKNKLTKDHQL
jgi:hypothetical protein